VNNWLYDIEEIRLGSMERDFDLNLLDRLDDVVFEICKKGKIPCFGGLQSIKKLLSSIFCTIRVGLVVLTDFTEGCNALIQIDVIYESDTLLL
jgi:hypothetical protein